MLTELLQRNDLECDLEFGNAAGFFSATKSSRVLDAASMLAAGMDEGCARELEGAIPGAKFKLTDHLAITKATLQRAVTFFTDEDCWLFDSVSRFVVLDRSDRSATIAGQTLPHRNRNIYYQYPVTAAKVPVGERGWLAFHGTVQDAPPGFIPVFYIRDEATTPAGKRWIVHHRLIVTEHADRMILRGCNPRFEGPLPAWVNALCPPALKRSLFRIRERRYPNFPLMTVGENRISAGSRFTLSTRINYVED